MKNFLFDVDGTLTNPRKQITKSFKCLFLSWMEKQQDCGNKVFLVTGSDKDKTIEQVGKDLWLNTDGCYQNCGNQLFCDGELIKESEWQLSGGLEVSVRNEIRNSVWNGTAGNNIERRIGMANISTIGRDCSKNQRSYYYEWDQEWGEREFICSKLSKSYPEVEFSIGGEISIDIYPKGKDKSQVLNDIDGETIFFGDRCIEGGNDFSIATKSNLFYNVSGYKEVETILQRDYTV